LLRHSHQGIDLKQDYAQAVLASLFRVWKRPVQIETKIEEKRAMLRYDGKDHAIKT
jgi:stage V sporulation protein R